MDRMRALLVNLAQIMMVVIIVIGTIGGFVTFGSAGGLYGGFSFGRALVGAIIGFCVSGVAMSFLAIMLDIRQAMLRIQAKGLM